MKKILSLVMVAAIAFTSFAKDQKKMKISDSNLQKYSYVTKIAESYDMEVLIDDYIDDYNMIFLAINKDTKAFALNISMNFTDAKIVVGMVRDENGKILSKTRFYDKKSEIESYLKEYSNKIQFMDSAGYTLSDNGILIWTALAAFYRAAAVSSIKEIQEYLPQNIQDRNAKILTHKDEKWTEDDINEIIEVLAQYNN